MLLSRLQSRRFFKLFDPLTEYANKRLDVVSDAELHADAVRGISEQAQAKVSHEIWQNLFVIDEFVSQNPAGFTAGELEVVASWRDGLTGTFLVDVFPDGQLRFVGEGYAFEVRGFSKDIESVLAELPAAVSTTLLPFDGVIVYAEYLGVHLIDFGEGMLTVFDEEILRIYDEGRIVESDSELLRVADELRDHQLERDTEAMLADLEAGAFDAEHDSSCDCGHDHGHEFGRHDDYDDFDDDFDGGFPYHKGVLAGLTFEEREQAIENHMSNRDDDISERLIEILDEWCVEGPLVRGLVDLLRSENRMDVHRFANYLGMEGANDLKGDDLYSEVVAHIGDDRAVQDIVNELSEYHIEALRELAECGGRWDVRERDIVSLRKLPVHEVGISYIFHDGDTFSFIMPDEVVQVAKTLDWDEALGKAKAYREVIDVVDKLVELRGIVPAREAIDEYKRCYPDGYSEDAQIVPLLMRAVAEETAEFDLLQNAAHELFILHYELFMGYREEMGIDGDPYFMEPIHHGELGDMLEGLLDQQAGKDPRMLTDEMLAADNLFEWKLKQPPVWAFCQFLDAHVPDVRDDYYFADRVIEELLEDAKWGIADTGAQRCFAVLEQNDFIPEADEIQTVLDLWMNLLNGLPVWPNNGWSPNDLMQIELGHPVFFNDDGSVKKVGRNDPCPCGSGLKYKKCCGK